MQIYFIYNYGVDRQGISLYSVEIMARHPSLEEFLAMEHVHNLYINYKTIECYMRKGRIAVDNEIVNALTIARIKNTRRANNVEINPRHRRTGLFAEFESLVRKMAVENDYDGVYIEEVLNPFLPDVLVRYGYRRVNNYGFLSYNYWYNVK